MTSSRRLVRVPWLTSLCSVSRRAPAKKLPFIYFIVGYGIVWYLITEAMDDDSFNHSLFPFPVVILLVACAETRKVEVEAQVGGLASLDAAAQSDTRR